MEKHLIVISVDALVFEDLEYAKTLSAFGSIINGGAIIERVRTIYPSLTHPVHATVISGATAGKTGITNNYLFDPEAPDVMPRWYDRLDDIKCDTLLHAAKRAGLTTAVASWPLTVGGEGVIDHNVPCVLNYHFDEEKEPPLETYKRLGATDSVVDILDEAIRLYGHRDAHPEIERVHAYCCAKIIKRYKPHLLLTHPSHVDAMRHRTGVFSDGVREAIRMTDEWIGEILSAVKEAGIEDSTDVVILSDHGQLNITRTISPNVYLKNAGYVKADANGKVISYDAFAQKGEALCEIYLHDKKNESLYNEIYSLLKSMASDGIYGFERVFTEAEVNEKYGFSGDFSFVIETDGYTSFGEWLTEPAIKNLEVGNCKTLHGTHGHLPEKGPQPTFIAKGPSFKSGVTLPSGSILNHAPTLAAVLGISLKDSEGTKVSEILK